MSAKSGNSMHKAANQLDEISPEWLPEDFQKARRAVDVLPEILGTERAHRLIARGRPKSESPKLALTIRYDAEIIESFRATGPGWQTRMNSALREWLTQQH